jgi:glycosyltransferase involved in cell wall biosynthesis
MNTAVPTLGVVAIAHNDEKDLPAFLDHLLPWVNEIVIVDDGSTDHTEDIALQAGPKVKFLRAPRRTGEYDSQQRNKGIEVAASDWLLHMDIDERVTPDLAREILEAIREVTLDAYRFRRLNFFLHRPMRGGGWQYWNQTHLARRDTLRFAGKMQEVALLDAPPARVGQLHCCMWHLNDADYAERVRKTHAQMQAEAETLLERGVRVRWYHLLLPPLGRALQSFFGQGGYREGIRGLIFALYTFAGTFNWWACAWDRQHAIARTSLEQQLREQWLRVFPTATSVARH